MKKKVLLSSIATIALCLCLIAGSTFALFTSKSEVNIAVTAGKVDMVAGIAITKLESVKRDVNGTIVDEKGNTYSYEDVSPNFTNGGTAKVDGSVLTLEQVTPGDKVTFEISGTNNSNVTIQYRVKIACESDEGLMSGLKVTIDDESVTGFASYVTAWKTLTVGTNIAPVEVSIELPVSAGNDFQNKTAKLSVLVEAVQGNASTTNEAGTGISVGAATQADLSRAIESGKNVVLTSDIDFAETLMTTKDVVIDLNGKTITAPPSGCLFQSQSNADPDLTITSPVAGAEINVSGGDTSILLGYGNTEINNVTLNVTGCDNYSPNPFKVYGDLTLGEGTVIYVDYLGTSLISNSGAVNIVIDGAQIIIGTFKTNATPVISLNQASTLEIKNTEMKIDTFVISNLGNIFISKADGVTIENFTFNVTGNDGNEYKYEAGTDKYRLVLK